jgi:hypothetical protein
VLPDYDQAFLTERHPGWSQGVEAGMLCVVLPNFPLPAGLTLASADLLLRLSPGYPDIAPDMWWFEPFVCRTDGGEIVQTNSHEVYLGRTWQRWSRHLSPDQWRPGVDSLESYLSLVNSQLTLASRSLAA